MSVYGFRCGNGTRWNDILCTAYDCALSGFEPGPVKAGTPLYGLVLRYYFDTRNDSLSLFLSYRHFQNGVALFQEDAAYLLAAASFGDFYHFSALFLPESLCRRHGGPVYFLSPHDMYERNHGFHHERRIPGLLRPLFIRLFPRLRDFGTAAAEVLPGPLL